MVDEVVRLEVRVPQRTVEKIDAYKHKLGYVTRNETIRYLLQVALKNVRKDNEWIDVEEESTEVIE